MRIGEVIGTVTLSRTHPSLKGGRYRLVVPLSLENLAGTSDDRAEALVVYDSLGAGIGSRIAFSEGREAAQPFEPDPIPLDAYNAAILDSIQLDPQAL
jgi:ethanolamine utilization protein EutN